MKFNLNNDQKEYYMILKTLIIDDEPLALNVLRKYTEDIKSIEVIGFCNNAVEAVEIIEKQTVDLIFLDINMPKTVRH